MEKITPPHNLEAERALLGSMILDNRQMDGVLDVLPQAAVLEAVKGFTHGFGRREARGEPLFFSAAHQVIFGAVAAMGLGGRGIDLTTLANELHAHGMLEPVGGAAYLASLEDDIFSMGQVPDYARIVAEHWRRRGVMRAGAAMAEGAADKSRPVEDALAAAEASIFELAVAREHGDLEQVGAGLREHLAELEAIQRGELELGVTTGFRALDRLTGGVRPGMMWLIGARPSMGKTTLAMNIVQHVALTQRRAVGVFSLEMGRKELRNRMLSRLARVPFGVINGNYPMTMADLGAIRESSRLLDDAPMFIDQSTTLTHVEVRSKARRLKTRRADLALIVVDYVQLMDTDGRGDENRNMELSQISRTLKKLAGELGVTVIAISQLSRDIEKRGENARPRLSDLRDSGSLEQDADLVMFVHRPDRKKFKEHETAPAWVWIEKQRNGPVGDLQLGFIGDYVEFVNVDPNTATANTTEEAAGGWKPRNRGRWKGGSVEHE